MASPNFQQCVVSEEAGMETRRRVEDDECGGGGDQIRAPTPKACVHPFRWRGGRAGKKGGGVLGLTWLAGSGVRPSVGRSVCLSVCLSVAPFASLSPAMPRFTFSFLYPWPRSLSLCE